MLQSYVAAGFNPSEFWGLSPRLYLAQMKGAGQRIERDRQRDAWLAWHIAALQRQSKLPEPSGFIGGQLARPKPQSPEVLNAMGMSLARAFGAKENV